MVARYLNNDKKAETQIRETLVTYSTIQLHRRLRHHYCRYCRLTRVCKGGHSCRRTVTTFSFRDGSDRQQINRPWQQQQRIPSSSSVCGGDKSCQAWAAIMVGILTLRCCCIPAAISVARPAVVLVRWPTDRNLVSERRVSNRSSSVTSPALADVIYSIINIGNSRRCSTLASALLRTCKRSDNESRRSQVIFIARCTSA